MSEQLVLRSQRPDGLPAWLGSGQGWEHVGDTHAGSPIYRRRVLRNGLDQWQTKSAGEHWSHEAFRAYDGPPDQEQFVVSWRDHYIDGDPRKGFVGAAIA